MRTHVAPERRPPLCRSSLDVAIWFILKAAAERVALDPHKLNLLLYLSQATYAAAHEGAALMPASFLAAADGPSEPTISLVLSAGLSTPPNPEMSGAAELVLDELWRRFGAMPQVALQRLIAADGIWKAVADKTPGAEITRQAMREAYARPKERSGQARKAGAPDGTPQADAATADIVREALAKARLERGTLSKPRRPQTAASEDPLPKFMLDGRPVSRWKPKRRIERPTKA